jgi:hypothetical protein
MSMMIPPDRPDAPKHWITDANGDLVPAVKAYLAGERLTNHQIRLIKSYVWHWVSAPAWKADGGSLEAIRRNVAAIGTQEDLSAAIKAAVEILIDPL